MQRITRTFALFWLLIIYVVDIVPCLLRLKANVTDSLQRKHPYDRHIHLLPTPQRTPTATWQAATTVSPSNLIPFHFPSKFVISPLHSACLLLSISMKRLSLLHVLLRGSWVPPSSWLIFICVERASDWPLMNERIALLHSSSEAWLLTVFSVASPHG